MTKRRSAAFLAFAIPGLALAQAPAPSGRWEGAIELPGQKLEVLISGSFTQGGQRFPFQALDGCDTFVESALEDWRVPGVAVAIVKDGEVVHSKGYGRRDVLTATVLSQPQYTLEPYRGTEFRFRELTGYSIRFLPDAKGAVNEALVIQPDGVYAAKRKIQEGHR